MRFGDLYSRWSEQRITQQEAAYLLGVSERTFRRHCRSYEAAGAEGLYDARLAKPAHNAAPVDEVLELLSLFESQYSTYSVSHFYDRYRDKHKGERSYNWVRRQLQSSGQVSKTKKRGRHRRKRERAPMAGMLLHQDGSSHEWVSGKEWDLIVTMDDATSEVYSGFFVEEEGTHSSLQGVKEVIEAKGLFCSLYTDRGSHYWRTAKAGDKVDKEHVTQFGRAMKQLGIEMIAAYSPEARGRSERLFGTLQQRLTKDLQAEGITSMEAANRYLKETYWAQHNKRFAVKAREDEGAFVPWFDPGMNLNDILCIQEQRTVNKDNTVSYQGKQLQIPKHRTRYHFSKAKVRVHEYQDRGLAIFHGPRCLGRYDEQGELLEEERKQAA